MNSVDTLESRIADSITFLGAAYLELIKSEVDERRELAREIERITYELREIEDQLEVAPTDDEVAEIEADERETRRMIDRSLAVQGWHR